MDYIRNYVKPMEVLKNSNVSLTLIFSVVLTLIAIAVTAYLLYNDHVSQPKDIPILDNTDESQNDENLPDEFSDNSLFGKKTNPYSEGATDKYSFQQTDEEIEVFIPLDPLKSISKRDISVKIQAKAIRVSVSNEIIIEGKLFDEILPDECNWQIHENRISKSSESSKVIWITLYKKTKTEAKNYWKSVLLADAGPSVYRINPDDKNAIKNAVKSLKESKSDS